MLSLVWKIRLIEGNFLASNFHNSFKARASSFYSIKRVDKVIAVTPFSLSFQQLNHTVAFDLSSSSSHTYCLKFHKLEQIGHRFKKIIIRKKQWNIVCTFHLFRRKTDFQVHGPQAHIPFSFWNTTVMS